MRSPFQAVARHTTCGLRPYFNDSSTACLILCGSRSPVRAAAMTFSATNLVRGSSLLARPSASSVESNAAAIPAASSGERDSSGVSAMSLKTGIAAPADELQRDRFLQNNPPLEVKQPPQYQKSPAEQGLGLRRGSGA